MSKQLCCKSCGKEMTESESARAFRLLRRDEPNTLKSKQLPVFCLACARKKAERQA